MYVQLIALIIQEILIIIANVNQGISKLKLKKIQYVKNVKMDAKSVTKVAVLKNAIINVLIVTLWIKMYV